jgi:hypothetical protein
MLGIADRFEHDLVTFGGNWAPYGGPPEAVTLPEFVMTRDQMAQHHRSALGTAD